MFDKDAYASKAIGTPERDELVAKFFPKRAERELVESKEKYTSLGILKAHQTIQQLYSA